MNIETRLYDVPTLECADVILRAMETSDAPDIYDYAHRADVTRYLLWDAHRSLEDTLRFIRLTAELNECRKRIDWCIEDKATRRVVGACGVAARSPEGEMMELGYVLHPDFQGRGIMTRAAAAMRDYVFSKTTCLRLEGRHFAPNAASGAVMKHIGMTFEGTHKTARALRGEWLDESVWAITREDWQKMQPRDRTAGEEKLRGAKCFALDMDGTIYLGDRVLPGAHELMDVLKKRGVRAVFLTNNSSRGVADYVKRLNNMGFDVTAEDILSSGQAAAAYLLREYPNKRVFVMGNDALKTEMRAHGIEVVEDGAEVVLAGFDTTLDYEKLTRTCDYVRAGLPFIATHPDLNCPTDGGFIPDLGSMLALIEKSAGRKPDIIIGKPYREIAEYLIERTGVPREKIAMIGDRLYTDVATGVNNGMISVLVLSGETKREQLSGSTIQPDLVASGVDELCRILTQEA